MNTQLVNGGGLGPLTTRRAYYTGTDTLYEGYALCYNYDAADVTPENLTLSAADSVKPTSARMNQVEKPSFKNAAHFAGVVTNKSSGFTGPGFVEFYVPGSSCMIYTEADCDHESAVLATMNSGQRITFTTGSYAFKHTGLAGRGSAMILGDVDRSTTAGLVQAYLEDGPPSGGVQVIDSLAMIDGGAASAGGSIYYTPFGVTVNVSADAAFTTTATPLGTTTGSKLPIGTMKVFKNAVCASAAITPFSIICSTAGRLVGSLAPNGLGNITGTLTTTSLASDSAVLVWSGNNWVLTYLSNSLMLYTT
jgi:hypothetical protein